MLRSKYFVLIAGLSFLSLCGDSEAKSQTVKKETKPAHNTLKKDFKTYTDNSYWKLRHFRWRLMSPCHYKDHHR